MDLLFMGKGTVQACKAAPHAAIRVWTMLGLGLQTKGVLQKRKREPDVLGLIRANPFTQPKRSLYYNRLEDIT